MSRKLVVLSRLIAIGSASVLFGLMAGGCASGGQTSSGSGGSSGTAGYGGSGATDSGFGGTGGGTGGTGATDGGGAGGASDAGDAGPDGSGGSTDGGGAGGIGGTAGTGGTGTGGTGTGGCGSKQETCNGLDDNCNGQIDEGDPGGGDPCTVPNAKGVCAQGTKHCTNGVIVCTPDNQPSSEICDGLDNNCDGQVDEGNPGGNTACNTGKPGICASGTTACVNGSTVCNQNYPAAAVESCNGLDDNCNGTVDEGNPGGGASCDTGKNGVCAAGTTDCQSGQLKCVQSVQASAEVCDGKDNDCNGSIDDNITSVACNSGDSGVCAAGHTQCAGGVQSCIADISPGSQLEHCDGKDDDCDGTPDNDPVAVMCGRDCAGNPTSFPHVLTIACNGACSIPAGGCEPGWHDDDGVYCNGCEKNYCTQNPTINACASATSMTVPSSVSGQIITQGAAVWYQVKFTKPSPGSNFNPRIQLTAGGTEYRMDVLSNCSNMVTCPGSGGVLPSGSVNNGGNITDWSMDFSSQCQASTCKTDNSGVPANLYVKITRTTIPGATSGNPDPECDQFTLAVSQ